MEIEKEALSGAKISLENKIYERESTVKELLHKITIMERKVNNVRQEKK